MKTDTKEHAHRRAVVNKEFGSLVGKTVKSVRPLTEEECEMFGWGYRSELAFLVEFTDGTVIVPSQDPEGNGAGHLFIETVA